MSRPSDSEFWQRRLDAVGRARSPYLFLLALAGLFYYALESRVADSAETGASEGDTHQRSGASSSP